MSALQTDPNYEQQLIISTDTGTILATETIYHGTEHPLIPSPFVTSYTAWSHN